MSFGVWVALVAGAWLERLVAGAPRGLQTSVDYLLIGATALLVMLAYRRAVRSRLERARELHAAASPAAPPTGEPVETT